MRALLLNCTLKPAPAESNTEALARVVMGALAEHIGFTIPGQAWTYWNKGPGAGPALSSALNGSNEGWVRAEIDVPGPETS